MYKILVVDDNPDFQQTLAGILTDIGYTPRSAMTDREALNAILEEPFDFAFMDVRLHEGGEDDVSGLSLALAFRGLNPRRESSYSRAIRRSSDPVLRAIRYLGVVKFVQKGPDLAEQVLKIIEESEQVRFNVGDETRLAMSLATGQPPLMRARDIMFAQ